MKMNTVAAEADSPPAATVTEQAAPRREFD
jgi:hypothetical protein